MKYIFIAILHNLELDGKDISVKLKKGILTNKESNIKPIFSTKLSLSTLGLHSMDEFIGTTYYFLKGEFDSSVDKDKINKSGTGIVNMYLNMLTLFILDMWRIKDHDIYIRDGFLYVYDKEIEDGMTFKSSMSSVASMADGSMRVPVVFSKEEIEPLTKSMWAPEFDFAHDIFETYSNSTTEHMFKGTSFPKLIRAMFYVHYAHSASQYPMKMLYYTIALETLLSNDTQELSHKVAERTALLLGTDAESRLEVYKTIKEAYSNRSKIAHGDLLKNDEQFKARLVVVDDYLRKILNMEDIVSLEGKDLEDHFLGRLFA